MTEEVDRLILLAEQDPTACVETCNEILSREAPNGQLADAHRALGIALRSLGEIEDSIRELQLARDAYRDHGDDAAAAEAIISWQPRWQCRGDSTMESSRSSLYFNDRSDAVRAHAQVQKAGLIARTGDLNGAIGLYELAEPVLKSSNDLRWLALLYSTRGLVLTYQSEFEGAERDLRLARDLFLELDRAAPAAEMVHNLGFVAVQKGDIARGLSIMLDAEELWKQAGLPTEAIASDRSYAYMLAGLPGDAFQIALSTARRLGSQSNELERAEALYLAARAALASGDAESAVTVAEEAVQPGGRPGS